MNSDVIAFNLFGLEFYAYGSYISLGCILAAILLLVRSGKPQSQKSAAALTCLLSPIFGLVCARIVYVIFDVSFAPFLNFENTFNLHTGGLSMFGALTGAMLAAVIAAKANGIKASAWLDVCVPSAFLFIAAARFGEGFTTLGISRPLVTDVLKNTFLAFHDEYDAYLRTYLLEGMTALLLCITSIIYFKRHRQSGYTIMCGALLFGTTQTLFESLRFDAHLRFSFVGLQQVLSIFLFSGVLVCLSIYLIKQKRFTRLAVFTICLLPVELAAILGLEFMIDRSQMSKWLSYAMYVVVLAVPAILGLTLLEKKEV
ncbi:MAG: hypothetical protein GX781_05285 [Clostridiales bacterium]|nr:hypothetical protein [Clostridiales bacterium]